MPFQPVPRTLYATGHRHRSDPRWMICLPNELCWDLYEGSSLPQDVTSWVGWKWQPDWPARTEIASNLTDEEISSLADSDGRAEAVAQILEARKPAGKESSATLYLTPREPAVRLANDNLWILYPTGSEMRSAGCPPSIPSGWVEIAQNLTSAEVASLVDHETRLLAIVKILEARKSAPAPPTAPTLREANDEAEAEVERWKQAARRLEAEAAEAGALVLSHEGRIEILQRDLEAAQADATRYRSDLSRADTYAGVLCTMALECLEKMGSLSGNALDLSAAVAALIEERDRYCAIVREALEVAHAGAAADERLPEIVRDLDKSIGDLLDERDRLRAIIVGLAAKLAGVDG